MATLPNKDDENGFLTLVFDRQCAFLLNELQILRKQLLGSEALIALQQPIVARSTPRSLTQDSMPKNVLTPGHPKYCHAFVQLCHFVGCAAWGDALQRWAEHLPPVQPSVPLQGPSCSVQACKCKGTLPHRDIQAMLKAAPRPEWDAYLDFVESLRANGTLVAASAAALRARQVWVLERTEDVFFRMVLQGLQTFTFPHNEIGVAKFEQDFPDLLQDIKPLPAELVPGLESADPATYTTAQLDELRERGRTMRQKVIRTRKDEGNVFFKEAVAKSGREAEELLEQANAKWISLVAGGGLEGVLAHSNFAASALQKQK